VGAFAAYAGDIAEGRGNAGFVAFFAVAGDGEAVRFVAHGLQEVQGGAVGRQAENFPAAYPKKPTTSSPERPPAASWKKPTPWMWRY